MRFLFWRPIAAIAARPAVMRRLLERAFRTPYTHIASADGSDVYMYRWWLFNAYGKDSNNEITAPRWTWLPSIRIHLICRPDQDRDLHDHPWNARTIILRGWYDEERPCASPWSIGCSGAKELRMGDGTRPPRDVYRRSEGYTGRLLYGQYHRISAISPSGVYTLFFTWAKRGTWGFMVNGHKVPWRDYLGINS